MPKGYFKNKNGSTVEIVDAKAREYASRNFESIVDIENKTLYEVGETSIKSASVKAGSAISVNTVKIPVNLKIGAEYKVIVTCTNNSVTRVDGFYEIDSNGSRVAQKSITEIGAENVFFAKCDTNELTIYTAGNRIVNDGEITISVKKVAYNESSVEKKVIDLAGDVEELQGGYDLVRGLTERKGYLHDWTMANSSRAVINVSQLLSIAITVKTGWRSALQGYDSVDRTNRVYDSGWIDPGEFIFTKLDQALYYTIIAQTNPSGVITTDQADQNVLVYATTKYDVMETLGSLSDTVDKVIQKSLIKSPATFKSISHRGRYGTNIGMMCGGSAVVSAKKYGFTVVENDVNISSDGVMVMWHDTNLAKIGDPDHSVSDYTLEQLKMMDFGSSFGSKFAGEKILTFEEWLFMCKCLGLECYIDFKITGEAFTDALAEEMVTIIRRHGMLDHVSYLNNHAKIRKYHKDARLLVLTLPTAVNVESLKSYLIDGEFIFNPSLTDITSKEIVNLALDNGYGMECWYACASLDDAMIYRDVERAIELGVQRITLDKYTIEDIMYVKYGLI